MALDINEGRVFDAEQLVEIARQLQSDSDDTQERTAERLGIDQPQVSKALRGETQYRRTCVDIVELYSGFTVEYPCYRLKSRLSQ